ARAIGGKLARAVRGAGGKGKVRPMTYTPPQEILERYASVLVNFALGGGRGVQPEEVVRIAAPESAKPLYAELRKAVWRAGGHAIGAYEPDDDARMNFSRAFFETAGD